MQLTIVVLPRFDRARWRGRASSLCEIRDEADLKFDLRPAFRNSWHRTRKSTEHKRYVSNLCSASNAGSSSDTTPSAKMGRLHSNGKGISSSAIPYSRTAPAWLKTTPDAVVDQICKLAKKGATPSQIGVVLRDSHGIAQVKIVTGRLQNQWMSMGPE